MKRGPAVLTIFIGFAMAILSRPVLGDEIGAIEIAVLKTGFSLNEPVGTHHEGLLKRATGAWYWSEKLITPTAMSQGAYEVLNDQGFRTIQSSSGNLFGSQNQIKPRYLLGAVITSAIFNTYTSIKEQYSEAQLAVEWQLYDSVQDKLLLRGNSVGRGQRTGITSQAIIDAFKSSLKRAIDWPQFAEVRKPVPTSVADVGPKGWTPMNIVNSGAKLALPAELEKALNSVVVILTDRALGSGFLVSAEGYILTAAHVISNESKVTAKFRSGLSLPAEIVRFDQAADTALLKVPGNGYSCLKVRTGLPGIGEEVFALGAPRGLEFSVSRGIISGQRLVQGYSHIQTDASVNPGNSGGPLLDKEGQAVGLIVFGLKDTEGLAFGVSMESISKSLGLNWSEPK